MRNKSEDLKNALFEQLERLNDDELDLEKEIKRTKAITDISQVLVNLAKEEIQFNKLKFNYGEELKGQFFETKQIG